MVLYSAEHTDSDVHYFGKYAYSLINITIYMSL